MRASTRLAGYLGEHHFRSKRRIWRMGYRKRIAWAGYPYSHTSQITGIHTDAFLNPQ